MKKILFIIVGIAGLLLMAGCPTPDDPTPKTYAVTVSPIGAESGESVNADVSQTEAGTTVTLTAALGSDRQVALSAPEATISPSTLNTDSGTATFTMPAQAVEVVAYFENASSSLVIRECEGLKMTAGTYSETDDLEASVQSEYGVNYTVADWTDLEALADIDAWIACMELEDNQSFNLLVNGEQIYSGDRQYFMRYCADGDPGSNFLIHDQIGSSIFLGSWAGSRHVLAKEIMGNSYTAETHTANSVSFDMHYVPSGGPFTMGEHVASTTQSVTLTKNFWMGKTEVTQGLWEDVWGTTWPGLDPDDYEYGTGTDYPAYYVNWFDAVAFCNLLTVADGTMTQSEQVYYSDEGLTTAYTKANAASEAAVYVNWSKTGYRLPTEAEWEYAARYIDGTSWNHGDHASGDTDYACYDPGSGPVSGSPLASDARISDYAWWDGNNSGVSGDPTYGSKEVGKKTENALGLYDMSGNVYEWCYDWYTATYSDGSETDPIGSTSGSNRVYRGGYWYNSGDSLRCADRNYWFASFRINSLGFRLCRTAD